MAYAKLYLEHPSTDQIKTAPLGFSVTSLFFGPWVFAWRHDYLMISLWLLMAAALILVNFPWLLFPVYTVQAFFYNRMYLNRLLKSGWRMRGWQGMGLEEIEFKLGIKLPRSMLTS